VSTLDTVHHSATTGNDGWLRAWPLSRRALVSLASGGALLLVVWTGVGLLYMWLLDDGPVGDADRWGARWLEAHRTPNWNTMSHYGSTMSDTLVKVILVAVVGGLMVLVWRRWHDGVFIAVALITEATVFLFSSLIVGRDRPPVEQLDPPAPSGSFPSGHVAAAVAFYGGVFLVVCWHTRNRWMRLPFGVVALAAPTVVGLSRAYRGMHHPIDVIAGILLGLAALYVARVAMTKGVEDIDRAGDMPDRVRRLDLMTPDRSPTNRAGARP
jgi:membrane-associated phospholipid phosphatase